MAKGGFRGGFPGGGNQMQMMRQAQKMQQDLLKMQQELESITIDPEVVDPDDVEMLQDLVLAAVNGVLKVADEETGRAMSKLQGGMGGLF